MKSRRPLQLLLLASLLLPASGCMAIVKAPSFFGGTRGWINFMAGEKHFVHQRRAQPYALASGSVGLGDLRPYLWPLMVIDFFPSLTIDLLLLPISIPHFVGEGLDETRRGRAEQRRLELQERERKRQRERAPSARPRRSQRRVQPPRQPSAQHEPRRLALDADATQLEEEVRAVRAALAEVARAQEAFKRRAGTYSADLGALLARGTSRYRLPPTHAVRLRVSSADPAQAWLAVASPRDPNRTNARWFAVDRNAVVRTYTTPFAELPADCTLESLEDR